MFSFLGHVIILGDFNARTGTYNDFILKDGNKYLPNCQNTSAFKQPNIKYSFDNVLSNHGKWLLELCRTLDLRILNGRTKGDTFGQVTRHNRKSVSVVDYAIVDQEILPLVQSCLVRPPNYLSDHSQIATWFQFSAQDSFQPQEKYVLDTGLISQKLPQTVFMAGKF